MYDVCFQKERGYSSSTLLIPAIRMAGDVIELANGVRMPAVQLGTFRLRGEAVRQGEGS